MSKQEAHIEVIARGVLIRDHWVLACRNSKHGYYYLPGGHVEFGESGSTALARELMEEAGLRVRVGELLLTTEGTFRTGKRDHHELNLVFHVEHGRRGSGAHATPPPPVRSLERHIGFEWLDLLKLDGVDLRPRNLRDWLVTRYVARPRTPCSTWNTAIPTPGKRGSKRGKR